MEENQSMKQLKIQLAQSPMAPAVIELMKDLTSKNPIRGKDQWETICNALTLEIQSTMIRGMVDLLENIRAGSLHDET